MSNPFFYKKEWFLIRPQPLKGMCWTCCSTCCISNGPVWTRRYKPVFATTCVLLTFWVETWLCFYEIGHRMPYCSCTASHIWFMLSDISWIMCDVYLCRHVLFRELFSCSYMRLMQEMGKKQRMRNFAQTSQWARDWFPLKLLYDNQKFKILHQWSNIHCQCFWFCFFIWQSKDNRDRGRAHILCVDAGKGSDF